ncbi:MAG: PEP/pyruvate-binding domain-containing protein [bacterium]
MKRNTVRCFLFLALLGLFAGDRALAQRFSDEEIRRLIEAFKKDERGPFQAILWFYPDGSMRTPVEHIPQPGAIQHALPKDVVQVLARERHIFLGQILAGTPNDAFFDAAYGNARLKQYRLEQYLQSADDGWIFRKARYYRGAYQAEDEEAWGMQFLKWLAGKDDVLTSQFFLVRQAVKIIPHQAGDDRLNRIRAFSRTIADLAPSFTGLRIKIHGQPEASDLERVRAFRKQNAASLSAEVLAKFDTLEKDLEGSYSPKEFRSLSRWRACISATSPVRESLARLASMEITAEGICRQVSDLLWLIRHQILRTSKLDERLALLDLSHEAEMTLFRLIPEWRTENVRQLIEKSGALCKAAAGCGFLEIWEWERIEKLLQMQMGAESLYFEAFRLRVEAVRRVAEWGSGMVQAMYGTEVSAFLKFEPLAGGFIDDCVRGSVLLPLGDAAGSLAALCQESTGSKNMILGIRDVAGVRGLNPGVAIGELVIAAGMSDASLFHPDKIVVMETPPSDLKPVAGLAVSAEGNLVSHVQLLARNLGIPNAVLPSQVVSSLKPFAGQRVFYAVSPRGRVVMKREDELDKEERNLVEAKKRSESRIAVPLDKLELARTGMISLRDVRASDSGRFCGPKAANLAELKRMFPESVVEGFVIPFGVFRKHLNQTVPGSDQPYWSVLQAIFSRAARDRQAGMGEAEVEAIMLQRLASFREMLRKIPFLPGFTEELKGKFLNVLGKPLGGMPVFIRSDTNMEDLKDFTGAGLNLTVFNAVDETAILQAIRDVWASPYTERSYRWRQKVLSNPENVYPSILILPSVDVEKSGVLITAGVTTARPLDATAAFNRGAGGAVEGQAAESWIIHADGTTLLLSPSRQTTMKRLPKAGGVADEWITLDKPVLSADELGQLGKLAQRLRRDLPKMQGIETQGPFDVELGFQDGSIRLFQVRPYVENKTARSSLYLQSLDAPVPAGRKIGLDQRIGENGRL